MAAKRSGPLGAYSWIQNYLCDDQLSKLASFVRDDPSIVSVVDAEGKTLLHYCAERGSWACMRFLLSKGANPYLRTKRWQTPLHFCVLHPEHGIKGVELLAQSFPRLVFFPDLTNHTARSFVQAKLKNFEEPLTVYQEMLRILLNSANSSPLWASPASVRKWKRYLPKDLLNVPAIRKKIEDTISSIVTSTVDIAALTQSITDQLNILRKFDLQKYFFRSSSTETPTTTSLLTNSSEPLLSKRYLLEAFNSTLHNEDTITGFVVSLKEATNTSNKGHLRVQCLNTLIGFGASLNTKAGNIFHTVVKLSQENLLQQLLEDEDFQAKAFAGDSTKKYSLLNELNESGFTPLGIACANSSARQVELLLASGANLEVVNSAGRPVNFACLNGYVDVVKTLLKHGADIRRKDEIGNGVLHIIAQSKCSICIKTALVHLLQEHTMAPTLTSHQQFANDSYSQEDWKELLNEENLSNKTPFEVALDHNAFDFAASLLSIGASIGIHYSLGDFLKVCSEETNKKQKEHILMNIHRLISQPGSCTNDLWRSATPVATVASFGNVFPSQSATAQRNEKSPVPCTRSVVVDQFAQQGLLLLNNPNSFGDVIFVLKIASEGGAIIEKEIIAHKMILAPRSTYFNTLFTGSFQESSNQRIVFSESGFLTYDSFLGMLYYLYRGTIPVSYNSTKIVTPHLVINCGPYLAYWKKLLMLSDMFCLELLKQLLMEHLYDCFYHSWLSKSNAGVYTWRLEDVLELLELSIVINMIPLQQLCTALLLDPEYQENTRHDFETQEFSLSTQALLLILNWRKEKKLS